MTRLSNRQYPLLRTFYDMGPLQYMSIEDAQAFDQRPFRSMLIREWVSYKPKHGFHITKKGRAAYIEFQDTSIERQNKSLPLTSYFDPTAYGLHAKKVVPMKRREQAA